MIIVGTQCAYIDENSNYVGQSRFAEEHLEIMNAINRRRGVFEHSSIIFRRLLNYRLEFKMAQDLDLYLRASTAGNLHCLNETLTFCKIKRSGLTIQKRYVQRKYQELAYRSHYATTKTGTDIKLEIKVLAIERLLWFYAQPFYENYIIARTAKRSPLVWASYLILTLIIYPPLIKDYLRKILPTRN